MPRWSPDDLAWSGFRREALSDDLLAVIKTAALVERNAPDYVTYLRNAIPDDAAFGRDAEGWGEEETQHGNVLGRYASMADSRSDFESALSRFRAGFRIPLNADHSVRGSRTGEMVARCMVEIGTSSFYSAVADSAGEPLLRSICRRIASDEFNHYTLFLRHQRRFLEQEGVSRFRRLGTGVARILEVDDDELAYANHCGNALPEPYDRKAAIAAYTRKAARFYDRKHTARAARMFLKATGVSPQSRICDLADAILWRHVRSRAA
jgi:hypothetical protein